MILACPNCIARYRVEVEALGAMGRRVRCQKCGHVWHAEPPGYVVEVLHAVPEPDFLAANTAAKDGPARPQLPVPAGQALRPRSPSRWTWILSLLVLAACVVAYEARQPIVEVWPRLAPVYGALGIELEEGQEAKPARPQ